MEEYKHKGDNQEQIETTSSEGGRDEEHRDKQRYPTPKVWVASLSDYNAGHLHGAWVEVMDEDALWAGIHAVLASSPQPGAEEWAFHDYEGFGPIMLGEYESVEQVAKLGIGIAEHGPAFAHYASLVGWQDADSLRHFEDVYEGHYDSLAEYGEHIIETFDFDSAIEELPELIVPYVRIDAEALARDLELGGNILTSQGDGGIYVFEEGW